MAINKCKHEDVYAKAYFEWKDQVFLIVVCNECDQEIAVEGGIVNLDYLEE
jgi:hypothetical protein